MNIQPPQMCSFYPLKPSTMHENQRELPSPAQQLVTLALTKNVTKLLQRTPDELSLLPQVGCQETVCVGNGLESGLEGVLEGLGGSSGGSVCILDTSKLEKTLNGG
jgi:hypothetical protein